MINRLAAHRHAFDGEHRKRLLLVVIAGVIAKRSLDRGLARMNHTLQYNLGERRHAQIGAKAFTQLGARATQQSCKLVFRQRIGHWRHGAEDRRRIGAESDCHRERLLGKRLAVIPEIERTTTMRQPAHNDLVARDHLLPIDTEVLSLLARPARYRQTPGNQRPCVTRPAGLYRKPCEVNFVALPDDLLTRGGGNVFRRHVPQSLFQQR